MFFVDHNEPETFEFDRFAQKLVRADDDVDRAGFKTFDRLGRLLGGAEAREFSDFHGPGCKAVLEGLGVLFGKKRRRTEDRDLFAVHDGDEGSAQGHFGLSEAHVAAYESVHRTARVHVIDDGGDGGGLIGRFLKGKAFAESLIV